MFIYLAAIGLVFVGIIYNLIKFYQEFRETMDDSDMDID
jgi:hypothetical protein